MSTNTYETHLHTNPFCVLGVTTRDDRRKIVKLAEERTLQLDSDICQKARSDLTNPRTRLAAEMAWMPGVAPKIAEDVIRALAENPRVVRTVQGLPGLARANVMAAACELVADDEPVSSVAEFVRNFAEIVASIDLEDVLRDVNEDRSVSGFPEVQGKETIAQEFSERRKAYRSVLKNLLDSLESAKLVDTMTDVMRRATDGGKVQAPALLDDLVDSYEVETQGFLQKEAENLSALVGHAREAAPRGASVVDPLLDRVENVARNWHWVALPILISAKSRGIAHRPSQAAAYELRSLSLALNNDHGMLNEADRMTRLLRELFAELPDVAERLSEDAQALEGLRRQADEQARNNEQWEREITFRAEVGLVFKEELAISSQGIRWRGRTVPLDSVTRVRWGAVRKSINGVPTGTDYTIAFGDSSSHQSVALRKESTYSGFTGALWRGVCVRLLLEMVSALERGQSFSFGDITVQDDAVTLTRHKTFAANEQVRLGWNEVHVWSHDGNFVIGKKDDKKVYGSASYINGWNTHILEHLVRGGFKKGVRKLSDYLKD
ncbi:hypothetical protein OKW43_002766 [Paraburkholderia sp. WC7.3g]|uniref:hypothetical protein n=1 Tax=Paraburkholderia sp. WC7.3g TaxID=2991070 RepID=UPI003D250AE7